MSDFEVSTPAEKAVLAVVLYMQQVEAFRDIVMTETTPDRKFELMGEIIGAIMAFLIEHQEHVQGLLMGNPAVVVDRQWLICVDSVTSLVAYRYSKGLDERTVDELKRISQQARTMSARP